MQVAQYTLFCFAQLNMKHKSESCLSSISNVGSPEGTFYSLTFVHMASCDGCFMNHNDDVFASWNQSGFSRNKLGHELRTKCKCKWGEVIRGPQERNFRPEFQTKFTCKPGEVIIGGSQQRNSGQNKICMQPRWSNNWAQVISTKKLQAWVQNKIHMQTGWRRSSCLRGWLTFYVEGLGAGVSGGGMRTLLIPWIESRPST